MKIKVIKCIELDKIFKNASIANKELGIDASSIRKACKGERPSAGKHPETNLPLHWQYVEIEI